MVGLMLQARLAQLQSQLTGINITAFDAYKAFKAVLTNPQAYKLTNVTNPAFTPNDKLSEHYGSVVANPDQYLFWDNTHPTRMGHAILAQIFETGAPWRSPICHLSSAFTCRPPRLSRASRRSRSASARSPSACTISARFNIDVSVFGCSLPSNRAMASNTCS